MAKILIVEDDRATAHMLAYFIKALGHEAQVAVEGGEALKIVRAQPQDIIISDVVMVPMDGIAFTTQLRAEKIMTPVVLCSGNTNTETVTRARAAGANDFLTKPLKLEEIRRSIDRALTAAFAPPAEAAPAASAEPGAKGKKRAKVVVDETHSTQALAERLAVLLPGDFYRPSRDKLLKLAERSRALIDAELGLLGRDVLEALHAHSPVAEGPLSIHHLGREPLEEIMAGLLTEQGGLGPWFEETKDGTLVLLEIERLPMVLQVQLNTALRKHSGGRMLVTTAGDPDKLQAEARLDEGLYFRFASCLLRLPPVRECEAQLPELFKAAVAANPGYIFGSVELQIEEPVARALRAHAWPENMAELQSVAAWTVGRLRSPQVTMAQLPERFFKVRMPTLQEALVSAQVAHVQRALRIFGAPLEAAEALGIAVRDVEAGAVGSVEPLFRIGAPPVATESRPAQPAAVEAAVLDVLLVVADPVLRAAALAGIPERGLRVTVAADGLEAVALLAARPKGYGCAVLAGADGLFAFGELAGQFRRIAPSVRVAALADGLGRIEGSDFDYVGAAPRGLAELEEAITRLLLMA